MRSGNHDAHDARDGRPFELPPFAVWVLGVAAFSAATAFMLRQQLAAYTSVPDLGDPLFSMWRLAWVAHQLPRDPVHLFDANIFHPAARTLAYSDAMLLPAILGAPFLWLGAKVAVVYTSLVLFSYVSAGVAMFALAYAITRRRVAALAAGFVFAFDPFRFAHYSHLELLFTFCMPLCVLFALRALAGGRRADGALAGLFLALQGLSSMYYGAYLAVSVVALMAAWFVADRTARSVGRTRRPAALVFAVAAIVAVPATLPYWQNRGTVGVRTTGEVREYSAALHDYLTANGRSNVYGVALWSGNNGERKLFTGAMPVLLGAAAFVPPIDPIVLPASVALVVAVDASRGLHGATYSALYWAVPPFRAFRAPARFRAVAGFYLALLVGIGVARIVSRVEARWPRRALLVALAVLLVVDLGEHLDLQPVWDHPPGIYRLIPDPHATIADLPLPWDGDPFWHDPVFMYFSTFHWHPLVNGSSGFAAPWYDHLGLLSRDFPSDPTLDAYRRLGTEYFVLHEGYYGPTFKRVVADAAAQPRLQFVASDTWEEGECRLYKLVR